MYDHYLLAAADIQTCATLCDALSLSLSPLCTSLASLPPPRDRFSRHFSAPLLSLYLSLSLHRCLSSSHLALHSRTRLFSIGLTSPVSFHFSHSRPNFLIPSLFPVVTNKSKLSPAEKNARRFPEQRKAGFLAWFVATVRSTHSANESVSRKYPGGAHGPMDGYTDRAKKVLLFRYHDTLKFARGRVFIFLIFV